MKFFYSKKFFYQNIIFFTKIREKSKNFHLWIETCPKLWNPGACNTLQRQPATTSFIFIPFPYCDEISFTNVTIDDPTNQFVAHVSLCLTQSESGSRWRIVLAWTTCELTSWKSNSNRPAKWPKRLRSNTTRFAAQPKPLRPPLQLSHFSTPHQHTPTPPHHHTNTPPHQHIIPKKH